MGQAGAQEQLGVERRAVVVGGLERHHHVGAALLRPDEGGRVGLAAVKLGEDLIGRVAAPRAIAVDLPLAPEGLGGCEEDAHVIEVAQLVGVVAQQALEHREAVRHDVRRRAEGAVRVLVDRLEDRLARPQVAQVLRHDVHVVGVRMQWRDRALGPLPAVVAVVVVEGDVGDLVLAQDAHEAARDGGLAGGGVSDDAEDDRTWHRALLARLWGWGPGAHGQLAVVVVEDRAGQDVLRLDGHQVGCARARRAARTAGSPGACARGRARCGCCVRARSAAAPPAARRTRAAPARPRASARRPAAPASARRSPSARRRRSRGSGCGVQRGIPSPGSSGRRSPCGRGSPRARRPGCPVRSP